jgi:hypothetical protein
MADSDSKAPASREDRLRQALRANLRRRKVQAKQRDKPPPEPPDDVDEADDAG